jgi:tetratricopeptide (TPR) repeat protein
MADGYCFISYSTADALDFARRLADKLQGGEDTFIKTWFDKRDIDPARDWDDQIVEGIRTCKCMLFVMTKDSTAPGSMCKNEWSWALKYKKPVVPIRLHKDAEQPFALGNRQWIDFTEAFEHGLSKLRLFLRRMDSPEGQLDALKDRLMDAQRDLRRATLEDQPRIQAEIDELKKQIENQQKIVENPKAAEEQTLRNIQAGIERERQPERLVTGKGTTKFINPPPGIAPAYFQDRTDATREIMRFLQDESQRMLTVVGRGGVGKTVAVCRVLKNIENGTLPDDLVKTFGEAKVDGIVYLSESGSHKVNFTNIFADLCKLLPMEIAHSLGATYKSPYISTSAKMSVLLDQFTSAKVILLLDNLEPLISVESFGIDDNELDDALCTLLRGAYSSLKIIVTTRIAPRGLNLCEPGRQRILNIDDGLESPYAENLLREMDFDGKLGLKNAPDELLGHAREHTRGFPRALEALFAILSSDRYTSLDDILTTAENYLPDYVVQSLVGEAFSRLDRNAQKVMQALAIYNHPVTPAAIDYILAQHLPGIDSTPILNRLVAMQFIRVESRRYYLHPVDREFALTRIPVDENDTSWNQKSLTLRAADYFAKTRKPREEWKKLDDLNAQLAEFDLRCVAGDFDTACTVLRTINFDYLFLWGHYHLIIQMHEKIQGKIQDPRLRIDNLLGLGLAYQQLGNTRKSITYFEQGVSAAQESNIRDMESSFFGNLGSAYAALGDAYKAIECHKQSLIINQEIGYRRGEGADLTNLGNRYADLGESLIATEFYEKALFIHREIGDRKGEENDLICLGSIFSELGELSKAVLFYQQAITIIDEIDDRRNKAYALDNLSNVYFDLGKLSLAMENFKEAIDVADQLSLLIIQKTSRLGLSEVYLCQNDFLNARATIETAIQYDAPQYNHSTTALYGIITLRQGDDVTALVAFDRAIIEADELLSKSSDYYDALDTKGIAFSGLALCEVEENIGIEMQDHINNSVKSFLNARKIAAQTGIIKRNLRLIDELAKCDTEGILKDVRLAVEGKEPPSRPSPETGEGE